MELGVGGLVLVLVGVRLGSLGRRFRLFFYELLHVARTGFLLFGVVLGALPSCKP